VNRTSHSHRAACAVALTAALLGAGPAALAQSSDRERAQMLQMQQQLQRVQSDNAAMQRERAKLQDDAKDAERLKKESAQTSKDLARSQAAAAAAGRDAAGLRAQLEALRDQTDAQIAQWKKALEERDAALQAAAADKRRSDAEIVLLTGRLKAQTARADVCETKHGQALQFGRDLVDAYEASRLRLCEPVTGIWKVREEGRIQEMRDRLYELRLDVPVPAAPAKAASTAGAEAITTR
jgi:septal ring factor EnvC (AmiA/AmiB activator)